MPHLKRELGFWSSVGLALGAMIGAGIFVLTGIGAGLAGPALPLAFLVAGILAFFCATSSAELAAAYPVAGGTYEYARRLVSPRVGFMTGWIFAMSKLLESGTVALAFGAYFSAVYPAIDPRVPGLIIVAIFTAINYTGVRASSGANNIMVAIKVAVLAALVAFGLGKIAPINFVPTAAQNPLSVFAAAALVFFAYTGFARIATLGEEIKNPRQTIPKAMMASLCIAAFLYVTVSAISIGVLGAPALAASQSPLASVAAAISPALATIVAFGALVATASVLLGDLLASSRILFAMGRNRELPSILGTVHKKHGSPHVAELAAGAIAAAVVLTGNLVFSAFLTSLTILMYYSMTNFSALKLDKKSLIYPRALAAAGFIGCVALALFLPLNVWVWAEGTVMVGFVYYEIRKRLQ